MRNTEEQKHAAGGPGKSAKEGHVDASKHNAPRQKQHGERGTGKHAEANTGSKSRPG